MRIESTAVFARQMRIIDSPCPVVEHAPAVKEAWLRYSRADTSEVENLAGWLTTVTARVCLNVLRSRGTRREDPVGVHVPDPVVTERLYERIAQFFKETL